ncbi:MAG: TonB-dependent receptor plug domain-containing protein [Janthinobacterium lividum]
MKLKRVLTVCLLFLAAGLLSFAVKQEDDPLKKILTQLQKFTDNYPTEKVYLQLDKPYYAIGDVIYFKAYTTVGSKHQPSALSKILYVDLINNKDSVKQSLRLPMVSGLSWGDFALTDTLQEGNYRIRAYTQYMRNFGEDYFFDKTISVGNAISNTVFTTVNYKFITENGQQKINAVINYADLNNQPYAEKAVSYRVQLDFRTVLKGKAVTDASGNLNINFSNPQPTSLKSGSITTSITTDTKKVVVKTVPIKATSSNVDVQFFPESGNLLNGVRSKVAFKAVAADGLGIAIKGAVFNDANVEVAKISTQHLGMGTFMLFPESGKNYTAKVTFPDGSTNSFELPKAADQGFLLNVNNNDPDYINLHVAVGNETFKQKQGTDIMVVGQSGGDVYYTAKSKLESQTFSAKIPKNRFPSGIAQFTLFTQEGEPLNERIIFIQNPDQLNINISSAETTSPRQNVKLDFTAINKAKAPVVGSFSVAVTDETKVPVNEDKESTILSNLLLTSDIKGYIEQPGYYFAHPNEKTQSDLDVLMLTQGYHRFAWRMLMGNSFPALTYQPEQSMSISGIVKTLGGKPVPKGKVTLFTTSKGAFLLDTVTDANGRFKFDNLIFPDSIRFVIQARNAKDRKNVDIVLDDVPVQFVTKNKNSPDVSINLNTDLAAYLRNSKAQYDDLRKYGLVNRTIVLKEVTITEKKQPLKNSSNLNGAGNADQIIKADQLLQGCVTIDQCLQGRLLGVIFRNGIPYSTRSLNQPMQLIVDGIYMEGDYLSSIPPTDIASIEVLRSIGYTAIYGGRGGGGVLVINTKRGDDPSYVSQRYAPGIVTYNPRGFSRTKDFYAPKYDDPKTNKVVADLRTTIYWNPNLITDKDGKTSFSFFNADSKGTYRVVIEGIDDGGNLGRQVYHYKVE